MRHLLLDLDAPLMSFGGDLVDAYGVVRDFPAKSMVAGLFANALGWERHDAAAHAALQDRLVMGSARLAEGQRQREFQTAQLQKKDRGWTTRGKFETRTGDSYDGPHIRHRDMDADARVLIACRLDPAEVAPDLDALAAALTRPERPLFIGRKPFVPSRPLLLGLVEAATIPAALVAGLARVDAPPPARADVRAQWPHGEPVGSAAIGAAQEDELTDERHWPAGVHAGLRRVMHGRLGWPEARP